MSASAICAVKESRTVLCREIKPALFILCGRETGFKTGGNLDTKKLTPRREKKQCENAIELSQSAKDSRWRMEVVCMEFLHLVKPRTP